MSVPVEGRRLFFVAKGSAEMIRQALVLERSDEIREKRSMQQDGTEGRDEAGFLGRWVDATAVAPLQACSG